MHFAEPTIGAAIAITLCTMSNMRIINLANLISKGRKQMEKFVFLSCIGLIACAGGGDENNGNGQQSVPEYCESLKTDTCAVDTSYCEEAAQCFQDHWRPSTSTAFTSCIESNVCDPESAGSCLVTALEQEPPVPNEEKFLEDCVHSSCQFNADFCDPLILRLYPDEVIDELSACLGIFNCDEAEACVNPLLYCL